MSLDSCSAEHTLGNTVLSLSFLFFNSAVCTLHLQKLKQHIENFFNLEIERFQLFPFGFYLMKYMIIEKLPLPVKDVILSPSIIFTQQLAMPIMNSVVVYEKMYLLMAALELLRKFHNIAIGFQSIAACVYFTHPGNYKRFPQTVSSDLGMSKDQQSFSGKGSTSFVSLNCHPLFLDSFLQLKL